ncbi:hypothetical protein, partial [Rhizobium sp. WYCCWR 11146]|uniref:hypothetical protein n=1 Tax=Rhizobium sp. WYCCWR 11146 TaxID=2749833 RepID=UPI001AEDAC47
MFGFTSQDGRHRGDTMQLPSLPYHSLVLMAVPIALLQRSSASLHVFGMSSGRTAIQRIALIIMIVIAFPFYGWRMPISSCQCQHRSAGISSFNETVAAESDR